MTPGIYRKTRMVRLVSAFLALAFTLAMSNFGVVVPALAGEGAEASAPEVAESPLVEESIEEESDLGGTEKQANEKIEKTGPPEETAQTHEEPIPEAEAPLDEPESEPAVEPVGLESSESGPTTPEPAASITQPDEPEVLLGAVPATLTLAPPGTGDGCGPPTIVTLWAGQTIDAGTVTVWNDPDYLYVSFTTSGDWFLSETHVWVGDTEPPTTDPSDVAPGSFPYSADHDPAVNTYTYSIPLTWDPGTEIWVLAHASVINTGPDGGSETAWGGDTPFEGPRWGFYFSHEIQECEEPEGGIDLLKEADAGLVLTGTEVEYTFTVTNVGGLTLYDVSVDDDHIGHIGDIAELAPQQSVELTAAAVLTETTHNVATAVGVDEGQQEYSDEDDATVEVVDPSVQIVKTASPEVILAGEDVTYTYEITNTGDIPLYDLEVTDDVLGPIGTIPKLDPDESAILEVTVPVAEDTVNVGTVVGRFGDDLPVQGEVTDEDDADVDVVDPAIEIVKSSDAPPEGVPEGTLVTYFFDVTNVGDVTLYDISVDDDHLGHVGDIAQLAPGESAQLQGSATLTESTTNTVVASGEDEWGHPVDDEDDETVDTFLPFSPPQEPEAPEDELPFLPFTGSDGGQLTALALAAAVLGLALRRWAYAR